MESIFDRIKRMSKLEWLLIVFCILLGIGYISRSCNPPVKTIVTSDSIYYWKSKAGEEYTAKVAAIKDKEDLKKEVGFLKEEYDKIKKQDPIVITKTTVVTKLDSVEVPTIVTVRDTTTEMSWKYHKEWSKDNYLTLDGTTKLNPSLTATTKLNNMTLGSDLILDVIQNPEDKNTLSIVTRSNNPLVKITDVQGSVIDPTKNKAISSKFKPKRWGLGVHAGYGVGISPSDGKVRLQPNVSIGLNYNFICW